MAMLTPQPNLQAPAAAPRTLSPVDSADEFGDDDDDELFAALFIPSPAKAPPSEPTRPVSADPPVAKRPRQATADDPPEVPLDLLPPRARGWPKKVLTPAEIARVAGVDARREVRLAKKARVDEEAQLARETSTVEGSGGGESGLPAGSAPPKKLGRPAFTQEQNDARDAARASAKAVEDEATAREAARQQERMDPIGQGPLLVTLRSLSAQSSAGPLAAIKQSALNFSQPAPAVAATQQVGPAPPLPLERPPRPPVEPRRITPKENPWLAFKEREAPQAQDSGDASGAGVGEEGPGDGAGETGDDTDPALGHEDDDEEGEAGVAPAAKPKYSGRWKHAAWLETQFKGWKRFLDSTRDPITHLSAVHRPLTLSPSVPLARLGLGSCDLPHQDDISFLGSAATLEAADLYNPRWIYWDPLPLEKLRCLKCSHHLTRNGYPARPRRAAHLDELWYIIGMRYRCLLGQNAGCGKGFISYDSRLLAQLPERQRDAFHFRLSWRSGITMRAFSALPSIQRTSRKLPPSLLRLITNRRVIKAGVAVQADLTLVLKDFKRPSSDAAGVAELAPMALDRGLLGKSAFTLQDLSAIVLGRYLDKDEGIGVSEEWDTDSLPPAHAVYAAKDARVSLEIYEELLKLPVVPSRLLELDASLEGLRVVLLQADQTKPVARGVIELVPPAPTKATATRPSSLALLHDGIKLTPSRVVLRVTEILVPGARTSEYARDNISLEGGRALSDFPQPPFSMVEETRDQFPSEPPLKGWVNRNLYTPAGECFGILLIPDALVAELALPPHESSALGDAGVAAASATVNFHQQSPYRHNFLARVKNMRYAVMHIHTPEECVLCGKLSKNHSITAATESKRWIAMAKLWVEHTDGKTVFYKLPEHLEAYSKKREKRLNEKQTLQAAPASREVFDVSMRSSTRKPAVGGTFNAPLLPPPIDRGFRPSSGVLPSIQSRPRIPHLQPPLAPGISRALPASSLQAAVPAPPGAASRSASTTFEVRETSIKKKKTRSCHFCGAGKGNDLACAGKNGQAKCKRECRGCGRFYGDGESGCTGRITRYEGDKRMKCPHERTA